MNILAKTAISNALGDKFAKLGGDNPLFRTGLYAMGVKLAMRSFPVTLAALGAVAAFRYLTKDKVAKRSAPVRVKRVRTARTGAKPATTPAATTA